MRAARVAHTYGPQRLVVGGPVEGVHQLAVDVAVEAAAGGVGDRRRRGVRTTASVTRSSAARAAACRTRSRRSPPGGTSRRRRCRRRCGRQNPVSMVSGRTGRAVVVHLERLGQVVQVVAAVVGEVDLLGEADLLLARPLAVAGALPAAAQPGQADQCGVEVGRGSRRSSITPALLREDRTTRLARRSGWQRRPRSGRHARSRHLSTGHRDQPAPLWCPRSHRRIAHRESG